MCTVIKRQADNLKFLEDTRQHMSRLPSIDPDTRTIILCGFPNVGKSSFINKVSQQVWYPLLPVLLCILEPRVYLCNYDLVPMFYASLTHVNYFHIDFRQANYSQKRTNEKKLGESLNRLKKVDVTLLQIIFFMLNILLTSYNKSRDSFVNCNLSSFPE